MKIGILTFLFSLSVSFSAFSQTSLADLERTAGEFSSTLARSLPLNASLGLNWSDAHIGQFFPSIPPSFGVGFSAGFTTMNLPAMENLATLFGFQGIGSSIERFPFPAWAAEARIGGFFGLPFDVGFKVGVLPDVGGNNWDINYTLIGGDIRYAVLNRRFLPTVSVGVGFNYLRGGIGGRGSGSGETFTFDVNGNTQTVDLGGRPNVSLNWRTFSLDAKAQVSQSFIIATPFFGVGWSFAWSRAGYEVGAPNMNITTTGGVTEDEVRDFLNDRGINPRRGLSSHVDDQDFNFRLFGGVGLNLVVFRLDFTGMMCLRDQNYGASIGFRFQL